MGGLLKNSTLFFAFFPVAAPLSLLFFCPKLSWQENTAVCTVLVLPFYFLFSSLVIFYSFTQLLFLVLRVSVHFVWCKGREKKMKKEQHKKKRRKQLVYYFFNHYFIHDLIILLQQPPKSPYYQNKCSHCATLLMPMVILYFICGL